MTVDEVWIDTRESGLDPTAVNPSSGAWGLGQLTSYPHTLDPCLQLRYQREYIAGRYGTEGAAVAFWQAHGWY